MTVFEKDQSGMIKSTNNFVNDCILYDTSWTTASGRLAWSRNDELAQN